MKTRSILLRTGLVALVLAYPFAVVLGPRQGVAVLLAAALAGGNFLLMATRIKGDASLLAHPEAPSHGALTARTMMGGSIRWLLTFFLLWTLLRYAHPMAVVGGLSCVVASITLQALFEYSRALRDPSAGAGQ